MLGLTINQIEQSCMSNLAIPNPSIHKVTEGYVY